MQTTGTFDLANYSGTTVKHVTIREDLRQVPEIILERAPDVEVLDLSGNQLTELPDWLPRLAKLEVLFLSHNKFTHVPEIIGKLPRLRMLGMRGNQIERVSQSALPPSLIWLTLTDNQIQELPCRNHSRELTPLSCSDFQRINLRISRHGYLNYQPLRGSRLPVIPRHGCLSIFSRRHLIVGSRGVN
jgi:Leucine-rich repeat (LRR) protein